jgi:hypothetical protein
MIANAEIEIPINIDLTSTAACFRTLLGGYDHSRLREFVLGGTTRGILASMTISTLMSH